MKEQIKAPEKIQLSNKEIANIPDAQTLPVQNTCYQDAPGAHWVLQQHKNDPGRNEGCIK